MLHLIALMAAVDRSARQCCMRFAIGAVPVLLLLALLTADLHALPLIHASSKWHASCAFDFEPDSNSLRRLQDLPGEWAMVRKTYRVQHLPDITSPRSRTDYGDVAEVVQRVTEGLLHLLADQLPPDPPTLVVHRQFTAKKRDPQARESIFIEVTGTTEGAVRGLSTWIENSPLATLYGLRVARAAPSLPQGHAFACDIVRREDFFPRLVGEDENAKAYPLYYVPRPFQPRRDPSEMLFDQLLAGLNSDVDLCIAIRPARMEGVMDELTRYLRRVDESRSKWRWHQQEEFRSPWSGSGNVETVDIGHVPDPRADEVYRQLQDWPKTLQKPFLSFHIRVLAPLAEIAQAVASTFAEEAYEDGSYRLVGRSAVDKTVKEQLEQVSEGMLAPLAGSEVWQMPDAQLFHPAFACLAHAGTVEELVNVLLLPVAPGISPQCIRSDTDPPEVTCEEALLLGHDMIFRKGLKSLAVERGIVWRNVDKSAFVVGTPGMGKTNELLNIVWKEHARHEKKRKPKSKRAEGTPVILFECVKREYRGVKRLKHQSASAMQSLGEQMRVYAVGSPILPAFCFNPFEVPPNTPLNQHKQNLIESFRAAMSVIGPTEAVIAEAVELVYRECAPDDLPPTMIDLVEASHRVMQEKRYDEDARGNIMAAIETRLKPLTFGFMGEVLRQPRSVPTIESFLHGFSLIELDLLTEDQAGLVVFLFMNRLREYLRNNPSPVQHNRLLIIIDEAHVLLGESGQAIASEVAPSPRAFAGQLFKRLLVEFRAYGVGIICADQLATGVASTVRKAVGSVLAFRETDKEEREILEGVMNLDALQTEDLARLKPGEAFFMTEGYHAPRRIQTPNLSKEAPLGAFLTDEELLSLVEEEDWYVHSLRAIHLQPLLQLKYAYSPISSRAENCIEQITALKERTKSACAEKQAGHGSALAPELLAEGERLSEVLKALEDDFHHQVQSRLSAAASDFGIFDDLRPEWEVLAGRCERDHRKFEGYKRVLNNVFALLRQITNEETNHA